MGTRAKINIMDSGKSLVKIYKHLDGYPSGFGKDLANFLDGFKVVNGLGSNTNGKIANGMSCLAAQVIAYFKTGPGEIYLMVNNEGQEYNYEIYYDNKLKMKIERYEELIFNDTVEKFLKIPKEKLEKM